jgi:hypothetical protein
MFGTTYQQMSFETRLDRHWENHPMIFNYELDYNTKHQPDTQTTFQEERPNVEPNIEGLLNYVPAFRADLGRLR